MKSCATLLTLFLFVIAQSQTQQIKIEKGLSSELADYRKQYISNIHYKLSFTIPALQTQAIRASELLRFDLKKGSQAIQLDFKEEEARLHSVVVNGKKI